MRENLRDLIEEAGGIHSQAGLAKRWDVSPSYVHEAINKSSRGFPPPAAFIDGERPVWFGGEADAWRATRRRPGPRPT